MRPCDEPHHDCGREGGWKRCRYQRLRRKLGVGYVSQKVRFCLKHETEWADEMMCDQARQMVKLMEESSVFTAGIYDERNPPMLDKIPISDGTLRGVRDLMRERRGRGA